MSNSSIDDTILAVAESDWLKVARVIVDAARAEGSGLLDNGQGHQAIGKRIEVLVREGRLIAQGNLKKPRYGEVRLPGPLLTKPASVCVRQLRMLSGIKRIWAREHNKGANDVPTWTDLRPYLGRKPRCPQGGTYTLGRVEEPPKCSHGGYRSILP